MAVVTLAELLEAGVHFGHQSDAGTLKCFRIFMQKEMEYILLI